jgi:acyl dehydratase
VPPLPTLTADIGHLQDSIGREAVSSWCDVAQERITTFADATEDRQWIHLDADRASRESPYGTTIAHGFLTLSLISRLLRDAVAITGTRMAVNYGLNKVRFPAPVPSGSRLRGRFTLQHVEPITGGVQVTWNAVIEREGGEKPCCVAEWLVRYYHVT